MLALPRVLWLCHVCCSPETPRYINWRGGSRPCCLQVIFQAGPQGAALVTGTAGACRSITHTQTAAAMMVCQHSIRQGLPRCMSGANCQTTYSLCVHADVPAMSRPFCLLLKSSVLEGAGGCSGSSLLAACCPSSLASHSKSSDSSCSASREFAIRLGLEAKQAARLDVLIDKKAFTSQFGVQFNQTLALVDVVQSNV